MKKRIWEEGPGRVRPKNVDELWDRIVEVWNAIPPQTLINIRQSYRTSRIDKLIAAQGNRFEWNMHNWKSLLLVLLKIIGRLLWKIIELYKCLEYQKLLVDHLKSIYWIQLSNT